MPLPSVLKHGAIQCEARSKRTGLPCNNPAAHGCKTCRMHGAHKSRNVANGINSGKYKNGHHTKEAKERSSKTLVKLRYLEDIGIQGGFIKGARTRGPKPTGYVELDLNDRKNIEYVIQKINSND